MKNLTALILFIILSVDFANSQEARGDPAWKKQGIMDGNLVRTIFLNHGEVALWPFQPSGEWPKGSGQSYLDGVAPWVSAEVVDIHGDTVHPLETNYREFVDRDPVTGKVWGFQPIPGYVNLDQDYPAMSNDPLSWPNRWPDQPDWFDRETLQPFWNGFFGMGVMNADLETYFVMDDASDKEYDFYPDPDDPTRGGLGLRIEVRGFQWSSVFAEDVIFWLYDIKNDAATDYEKALFGMYIDFGIGGTDDSIDDQGEFDPILDITFAWDGDGVGGEFWGFGPVGVAGYAFLESPGMGNVYIYNEFGDLMEMIPGDGIDNDNDGLIDESRSSPIGEFVFGSVGIYNDGNPKWHWEGDENGDWDGFTDLNGNEVWDEGEPLNDDLGADGVGPLDEQYSGPDIGEGDGFPTDGEPDYNQTDNDESDQIGLSAVKLFNLHEFDLNMDEKIWDIMAFGDLDPQEFDVNLGALYSSGPFPLEAGQTERFSMALLFGEDKADILRTKQTVQKIYNADYNFSKPPNKPTLTAVPGDRRVTLYWDRRAESSFDRFLGEFDFEGYKIYRSTDPAFLETKIITDAFGIKTFRKAIFQCDLINYDQDTLWWVKGTHPADINGIQFDMGDDTGLVHTWTDTTVQNGQTYYYAVVAYDRGFPPPIGGGEGLPPTETTSIISIDNQGNVTKTDINTAVVIPNAPAIGYQMPELKEIKHIEGPGTGAIEIEIIDRLKIKANRTYQIEFHHDGIFETTDYSVFDVTGNQKVSLIANSPYISTDSVLTDPIRGKYQIVPQDGDVFEGLRISVFNDAIALNKGASGWKEGSKSTLSFKINVENLTGVAYPANYEIRFSEELVASTRDSAKFSVWNVTEERPSKFFFKDLNGDGIPDPGGSEKIYFWEMLDGNDIKTWELFFFPPEPILDTMIVNDSMVITEIHVDLILPTAGDVFLVEIGKPFRGTFGDSSNTLVGDIFQFTTIAAVIDVQQAKSELDRVAVVPNPYVASATWEPKNLFSTGRGARMVEFIHLPKECTIRIYTVSGYLVNTLYHNKNINDGSEFWNLRTKDGRDIAYGLYIFHIDAPGVGEIIGKFAVIK